jgi:hypothetical protein
MTGVIPVPESVVESQTGSGTLITCQWDRNRVLLGIFAIAFVGFVGFVIGEAMFGSNALSRLIREGHWIMTTFLSIPAMLVGAAGYGLIAAFFNHTDIHVTASQLEIRFRPIPWRSERIISKSEIIQLFVREKVNKDTYGRISKSYEIHWIDSRNQRRPLVRGLRVQEALYLENRLEEILGIEDQPVSGAYAGYKFHE